MGNSLGTLLAWAGTPVWSWSWVSSREAGADRGPCPAVQDLGEWLLPDQRLGSRNPAAHLVYRVFTL